MIYNISFLFDPLSLFFLFIVALISLPAAVYSLGYLKEYSPRRKVMVWFLFIMFVLSMALVITAGNAFYFLIVWEIMSLVSYFLVVFDREQERAVRAGMLYIIMTHIGTAFITAGFLVMYKHSGSFDLTAWKYAAATMTPQAKNTVFLLLLVGFGTKAGMVPLHIWLPYAHPQAPSHISALMSGVMIKTALYGILRFIVSTLGISALWWGNLLLGLAAVSCLTGIIYALMETDIKRLLAYSSVENVGIILLGIGASMLFVNMGLLVLAVFSLAAALYHLLNHALFKSLLFLCGGSVYHSAGTRNMERLGGLIRVMPHTAGLFLIGAMAISGLPPLNGFVSEWLTLQAFFGGALNSSGGMRISLTVAAAVLALTSGLAAACFLKAFGITFLAMPRSPAAVSAKEAPLSMRGAEVFLAGLVVLSALCVSGIMKLLVKVSGAVLEINTRGMSFSRDNFVLMLRPENPAILSLPLIFLALALAGAGIFAVFYFQKRMVKTSDTWDCGYYQLEARNEYTATAFSKPFRIAFGFFLKPYHRTEKIRESVYHVKHFKYELYTTPVFRQYIYDPALRLIFRAAAFIRKLQPGSIHLYISYIFITIILLIIFINHF